MGWWRTGHDDDILGDDPADALVGALEFHALMNRAKPSYQAFIDAAALVLTMDGERFLADPQSFAGCALEAAFDPPRPPLFSGPTELGTLSFDLTRAFAQIAAQYEATDYARRPRLSELLSALVFILSSRPERFLSDGEGRPLAALRAVRPA